MNERLRRPQCGLCKRGVDEFEVEQIGGGKVLWTMRCHGQFEKFTLPLKMTKAELEAEISTVFVRECVLYEDRTWRGPARR